MDLDLLDDILGESTKKVRAGAKFQPKVKPRLDKKNLGATSVKKDLGAISVTNTQTAPTVDIGEGSSSVVDKTEKAASSDNDRSFGVGNAAPQDQLPSSENINSAIDLDPVVDDFVLNSTENWQSCFENPIGESTDIYIGLDTLGDFLPDSATVLDNHIPSSEAAHIDVSSSKDAEHMLAELSDIQMSSQPETSASQDPLTGSDPIVSTNHTTIYNESFETEAFLNLEDVDMSEFTPSSGQRIGKSQPKLKIHAHRQRIDADSLNINVTEDGQIGCSSTGLSYGAPSQSTSEALAAEAPTDFVGLTHQEADIPGKRLEAASKVPRRATRKGKVKSALDRCKELASTSNEGTVAGGSPRKRRKPINDHNLIDESEDVVLEDGTIPDDSISDSVMIEDNNAADGFQKDAELQKKKAKDKSKKSEGEKDKPTRKRKKNTESSNQAAKAAPKKFSHRSRKKVDKALLEIPEDERDYTQIPLRDLILLAEHKEQSVKKTAKTSRTQLPDQCNGNEDGVLDGDEAADRGEVSDEEENCCNLFNYHTYMEKTPRLRWSAQDTELFYEGIRQFGSDLSMILHLFPGKTRHQMKLKYKQEERQHPKRLNEALSNPATDYSHFNMVIERLKQKAAEDDQNTSRADSVSLNGEEEMEEPGEAHVHPDEAEKLEPVEEPDTNENMTAEAESQTVEENFDEIEDDEFFYNYKSEL